MSHAYNVHIYSIEEPGIARVKPPAPTPNTFKHQNSTKPNTVLYKKA
jgi:hypothetical protein